MIVGKFQADYDDDEEFVSILLKHQPTGESLNSEMTWDTHLFLINVLFYTQDFILHDWSNQKNTF